MPPTVLHVIGTSDLGGTERFLRQLLVHADGERLMPQVCVIGTPGAFAKDFARHAGRVWHLGVKRATDWPAALHRWRGILQVSRPSLLVTYGARAGFLGRFLGGRRPVVSAVRSIYLDEKGRSLVRWLDRASRRRVRLAIGNSRRALQLLETQGYDPQRLIYIPPAADLGPLPDRAAARAGFGLDDRDVLVLCVASLKPVKNHELLLRASMHARAAGAAHTLWLVGDGPLRQALERLARQLGASHVSLLGSEAEVGARYAAADLCTLASHWEGAPTTLLEAAAAGVPIIATAVGDVPVLFADQECGRVVPPGDEDAFTRALVQAIGDADARERWRHRALEKARQWSVSEMVRSYERAFHAAAAIGDSAVRG